jgi:hypothetical protein
MGGWSNPLPPEADIGVAALFVILQHHPVRATQSDINRIGFIPAATMPLIQSQITVNKQAHAVVGLDMETVQAAVEI